MDVIVVIPTYNERENLAPLVTAILDSLPESHILVVDDNSPDGTGELAETLVQETGKVHVLHRPGKQGLGRAYVAGFRYALMGGYQRVIQMDADFSHSPEYLRPLLQATEYADVVIGSRNVSGGRVENWPLRRRLISKGGSLYTRLLLGIPVHDCTSGFKCFRREALEALNLDNLQSNGYAFQVEVNYACSLAGLRFTEVPIIFPDRVCGASKMSLGIAREAATVVLRLFLGLTPPALAPGTQDGRIRHRRRTV